MPRSWYVVRVASGQEERVRSGLEKRVKIAGLDTTITKVVVPVETVTEIKGGKKRVSRRKIYPGYVLLEIETDDRGHVPEECWFVVRETAGVGDFLGASGQPEPMAAHEVEKIMGDMERQAERPRLKIDFKKGDAVKIKEGPFENFDGIVEEVSPTKGVVRVVVTIFGRATPVDLEYWQVEAV